MLVVVFLRHFQWRWQDLHNFRMLLLVGPVGSAVSEIVPQILIDILGYEEFYNLGVSFAGGNVKAREANLVFDLWVSSTIHELVKSADHIFLSCKMHGSVSTDILMVLDVRLSSILEQDLYYGTIFGLHGVLKNQS